MGVVFLVKANRNTLAFVAQLDRDSESAQRMALCDAPVGVCMLDEKGRLTYYNAVFQNQILGDGDGFGQRLKDLIDLDFSLDSQELHWQKHQYHVEISVLACNGKETKLLYWTDCTELRRQERLFRDSHPSVMHIVIDNYEQLSNGKESARLELSIAVERLLEDFIYKTGGVLRRVKDDRFLAIMEERHAREIIAGKFKILEDVHAIKIDEKTPLTFSIGVGTGANTLQESEGFAVQGLDMALGRGGDQAAVKTPTGYRFFGGNSQGVEKQSRTKTRIVAGAIRDLILHADRVFVMGHRFGDLDSIGAAIAMAGAARMLGKTAHVVVDEERNLATALLTMIKKEVGSDLFLTPEQSIEEIRPESLLIITDTHSKDIIESDTLYHRAQQVVVIDHHRKTVNFIDNALIFHHEPHASSACEMVTELVQYFGFKGNISDCYANALLSGMMLDTKNFVMRTGVRTFEAAAFLRKMGADTIRVKQLFSGTIESYRSRTEIVASAEILGRYAIAIAPNAGADIRLAAPQAADELLTITHVDAAFVIYKVGDIVNISARSMGAVNVQVIMEELGGGGHQTMAATQLVGLTRQESKVRLLDAIKQTQDE